MTTTPNSDELAVFEAVYGRAIDPSSTSDAVFVTGYRAAQAAQPAAKALSYAEAEAWLIEWGFGAERRKRVFTHNAIADYRHLYKDATATELIRRPTAHGIHPAGKEAEQ